MRVCDTVSGGQFLRAYIERHNDPPIRNLITFGSQHMGIADMPACKPYDVLCKVARNVARAGVYNEWAQQNLVQVNALPLLLPLRTSPGRSISKQFRHGTGAVLSATRHSSKIPRLEPLPNVDQ